MITALLLVDDHDGFREFVRDLLNKEADMNVVGEASDGRSAIRLARESEPDIILMDVVMHGVGGIEATGQIISANPNLKVIAVSLHNSSEFVEAMFAAGASGYVLKDRATSELADAIRTVVTGQDYRGSGLT